MRKSLTVVPGSFRFPIIWIVGTFWGIFLAAGADQATVSMMRLSALSRVSIVWLFATAVLPFLIAAVAVLIQQSRLLYTICFVRCCLYGFFLWLTVLSFGSAAWLVQPMLQFTDNVSIFLLCLWCLHQFRIPSHGLRVLLVFCIVSVSAAILDYLVVSPYLAMLLNY